jgi:hypothetical protein
MTGERGTNGNLSRFVIPNFTNDDDFRVLAEKVSNRLWKCQSSGFIDFGLHDPWDQLFYGVLNRDDVASIRRTEIVEAAVDRGGFATSRWSSKQ